MDKTADVPPAEIPIAMVARDAGVKPSAPRQRRVYLVAPARWKTARLSADSTTVDWSVVASAPSAWSGKPVESASASKADPRRVDGNARRDFAVLFSSHLRLSMRAVRRGIYRLETLIVAKSRAAQRAWLNWDQANRRRSVTAFSFCVVLGAVTVPLATGVAYSQPELESHLVLTAPVTLHTLAARVAVPAVVGASAAKPDEIKSIAAVPSPTTAIRNAPSSSIALLSDVSTMDLMMPIAEPDLNIASHQSLWAQVGKEFGVDPLLLYSIALVESRSLHPGGDIGPTPWLFRVNDHLVVGERHHVQMQMAVASQLNATVQDVGIMQVYYPMHRSAVRDPLSLLDPKTNISVAAKILHDGMHETSDPVLGVGYYHSHTQQLARDYGTAVMTVYQRLKGVYRSGKNGQVVAR